MSNVVDFIAYKEQKELEELARIVQESRKRYEETRPYGPTVEDHC